MAPLRATPRTPPRTPSSADAEAGSTTIATCKLEKSTGKSSKCACLSWLTLFRRIPRERSAVRKEPEDTVHTSHRLCKLRKMFDDRRHLLIWRISGILGSFKKQRIGLHRTWPEGDGNSSEDIFDCNSQGESACEGHGVGSNINNPIMLDEEPDEREGPGGGSSIMILLLSIIIKDDDDYSEDAGEYFWAWSKLDHVEDSEEN